LKKAGYSAIGQRLIERLSDSESGEPVELGRLSTSSLYINNPSTSSLFQPYIYI